MNVSCEFQRKNVYLKKRLAELQAICDEDIDTSDIPELDESFWANVRVVIP